MPKYDSVLNIVPTKIFSLNLQIVSSGAIWLLNFQDSHHGYFQDYNNQSSFHHAYLVQDYSNQTFHISLTGMEFQFHGKIYFIDIFIYFYFS